MRDFNKNNFSRFYQNYTKHFSKDEVLPFFTGFDFDSTPPIPQYLVEQAEELNRQQEGGVA